MSGYEKQCVLYDRLCSECGECELCDLDPNKKCDNCGRCIEDGSDYSTVDVELINDNEDEELNYTDDFEETEDVSDEDASETLAENFRRDFGELFGEL